MPPDFSNKTINTVAKRAAFKCSNPDCRVNTVGPNSEADKATVIGEAAHIFGARPNAKRYNPEMTDAARAEITNAIWLCRNCHKLIDTDEQKYSTDILFAWREEHENYIFSDLGNATDRILLEEQNAKLSQFKDYPPIIRRIVIDKPDGWEYRLTAELMRHLNRPLFRRIKDLQDGLYIKPQKYIDGDEIIPWIKRHLVEAENMAKPIVGLFERLNESWGAPGEPGNIEEIHHITCLIRDYLEQVVEHEEQVYFLNVPEGYENIISLFKNIIGSQASKIEEIPDDLDEVVSLIGTNHGGTEENPIKIEKTITFKLPNDWLKQFEYEFNRLNRRHIQTSDRTENNHSGFFIAAFIIVFLVIMFSC